MTLDKIREVVKNNLGIMHSFRFKGTRNQTEEFDGRIVAMYPSVFIIELSSLQVKSFSYSDLLIENLEIIA